MDSVRDTFEIRPKLLQVFAIRIFSVSAALTIAAGFLRVRKEVVIGSLPASDVPTVLISLFGYCLLIGTFVSLFQIKAFQRALTLEVTPEGITGPSPRWSVRGLRVLLKRHDGAIHLDWRRDWWDWACTRRRLVSSDGESIAVMDFTYDRHDLEKINQWSRGESPTLDAA